MIRRTTALLILLVSVGLTRWILPIPDAAERARAGSAQASTAFTDREYVRNGSFDLGKTGWLLSGSGSGVGDGLGPDGSPALALEAILESIASASQEIHLPTQTAAATLSLQYRLVPTGGGMAQLYAGFVTESQQTIGVSAVSAVVSGDTGWHSFSLPLDSADVSAIQAARTAGERVYLGIEMQQSPANAFRAYLDDVSLRLDGETTIPALEGAIGYVGLDDRGDPITVNRIDPDGSDRQTLWTHPGATQGTKQIFDVAWNPDATALAFSSNHEFGASAFGSDAYAVRPDGSGLRRITNPPSKAAVESGQYTFGTVTGQITNGYGNVASFLIYVEGAKQAISHDPGDFNQTTGFSVPDVADLGAGVDQYVAFLWSNLNCPGGIEYSVAVVDVQAGGAADAGTLQFDGHCNSYNISDLTWKRDGGQIGFSVSGVPRQVAAGGEAIGRELLSGVVSAYDLAWSPADDRILYRQAVGQTGLYLTQANGGAGTRLVPDGFQPAEAPAWLPDGSGFVYVHGGNLYQHTIASGQTITLTQFFNESAASPSLSPNGNYVVFERWTNEVSPARHDLWILNRDNPAEMWPLISDRRSSNPDWSRRNPQIPAAPTSTATPTPTEPAPGATATPTPTLTPVPAFTPSAHLYLPAVRGD